mgnify:CR=1 FL=1
MFLTPGAIYLIAFRLDEPLSVSLKEIFFWIHSIQCRVENPFVLVVGTHKDRLPDLAAADCILHAVSLALRQDGCMSGSSSARLVLQVVAVSCCEEGCGGVQDLLHAISAEAINELIRAPAMTDIAAKVMESAKEATKGDSPVLPQDVLRQRMKEMTRRRGAHWSTESGRAALSALHNLGVIVMLRSTRSGLEPPVVVRPSWLTGLLSSIVTTRHVYVDNDALLPRTRLPSVWADHTVFPPEQHATMCELLRELDILYPTRRRGEEVFLVPCLLPDNVPNMNAVWPQLGADGGVSGGTIELGRLYFSGDAPSVEREKGEDGASTKWERRGGIAPRTSSDGDSKELTPPLPFGIIPRALADFLRHGWRLCGGGEGGLTWQSGFVVRLSPTHSPDGSALLRVIHVDSCNLFVQLRWWWRRGRQAPPGQALRRAGVLMQQVHSLLLLHFSSFPGLVVNFAVPHLLATDATAISRPVPQCTISIACIRDCFTRHQPIICECGKEVSAPPAHLAPDLLFEGIDCRLITEEDWRIERELGRGAFGTVYLGSLRNGEDEGELRVAIKILSAGGQIPGFSLRAAEAMKQIAEAEKEVLESLRQSLQGSWDMYDSDDSIGEWSSRLDCSSGGSGPHSDWDAGIEDRNSEQVDAVVMCIMENGVSENDDGKAERYSVTDCDKGSAQEREGEGQLSAATYPEEGSLEEGREITEPRTTELGDEGLGSPSVSQTKLQPSESDSSRGTEKEPIHKQEKRREKGEEQMVKYRHEMTAEEREITVEESERTEAEREIRLGGSEIAGERSEIAAEESETVVDGNEIGVAESGIALEGKEIAAEESETVELCARAAATSWAEFTAEVWLMNALGHPNIVRLVGVSLRPPALVMEAMMGGALHDELINPIKEAAAVIEHAQSVIKSIGQHNVEVRVLRLKQYELPPLRSMPEYQQMSSSLQRWRERVPQHCLLAHMELGELGEALECKLAQHYQDPGSSIIYSQVCLSLFAHREDISFDSYCQSHYTDEGDY